MSDSSARFARDLVYALRVSEALIDTGVRARTSAVVGEWLAQRIRMGFFRLRFGKHAKRTAACGIELKFNG